MDGSKKQRSQTLPPENGSIASSLYDTVKKRRRSIGLAPLGLNIQRGGSPASKYFTTFEDDQEPVASPDANSHFAYSTTLRRHGETASPRSSQFQLPPVGGVVNKVLSEDSEAATPIEVQPGATSSSKFVHITVEETLSHFNASSTSGLSSEDIPDLREQYGYNEFSVGSPEPAWLKFAKSIYENPLILLLFGSAVISALMGNVDDAISIAIAIIIVLTVAFVQESRSEKSLESLNKLVPHHCHILRDGHQHHLLANELVPGDIVRFGVGDRVPADIRLITAVDLDIDESNLTGETHPARKNTDPLPVPENGAVVSPHGRSCIAFMGTLVRNGKGTGVVVGTGADTEFGLIFEMMQEVTEKRTPLQLKMDELAQQLSLLSFGIIGVICLIGVYQQRGWLEMFTVGVSLAVAAIPEGLPIVTTVTLALGVLRMSKRQAIVKKLPSVEALGSVSVICSDKTGTLTKNEQTVTEIYTVDELIRLDRWKAEKNVPTPAMLKTLMVGNICNTAFKNEEGVIVGQSTDVALLNVLRELDLIDQRVSFHLRTERPFNSEQKYMAISGVHENSAQEIVYVKGSIEFVLSRCDKFYVSETSTPPLDPITRSTILRQVEEVAARGLRVISTAYGPGSIDTLDSGKPGLVFTGFQAMLDPPREGVAESIRALHGGGVKVIMITGDAEHTAVSIAKQLGIVDPSTPSSAACLTGTQLDSMSPEELKERVGQGVSVFARTTPKHKMAIVAAYQALGKVVAMTGDGVNDAPALKMADIGVSMGKSGTDVAKEAADVILVDDNFATILSAVEEGKSIFHNIQNFLSFQLSTAVAALTLITLSTTFRLSSPLNPMQILFINILMDGPPSQSLGVDPADHSVMKRPPKKKDAAIVSQRIVGRVLFSAAVIVLGTLFVYVYELSDGAVTRRDQTMTFTCFVFLDLASALQNRGLQCRITQNRMLITTVSISFIVQLALIYVPFLQTIFQTVGLSIRDLGMLLSLGMASLLLHEGRRRLERHIDRECDDLREDLRERRRVENEVVVANGHGKDE
ncbi:High affinity Ca2+/Mn2+ P-type ATPase-like protein [Tulasnella sp. 418]|nr:High affinity Ca2+/Mn2+ P-type ATPase-like protein [Tulasnella sp. 418]